MLCDVVDAETGKVSIDILCDQDCWRRRGHVLDVLTRLQVGLFNLFS